ncbi:MAG: HD domain-containing protein [Rhodoferax sp.]|nr:MAG: HD domain-containing protein [Rhodoferax sp.]
MEAVSFSQGKSEAHPDFVNALVQASETYSIVASQDIVDVRGLKLWAKGMPVSATLQQRLLERKLRTPLESCLIAEDGVTPFYLHQLLGEFLEQDNSLAQALKPHALLLEKLFKQIPLHPVAQLLLTTALATRPGSVEHAVQAMALAGGMAQSQSTPVDVRLAMMGGLLHDIGEAYVQPQYLLGEKPLDLLGHKHMMIHPRMGQLLLEGTTDYPVIVCRAIGEHHERLNGSGYPARLAGDAISPLGLLLAVVETTLGLAQVSPAPLTSASFALRVVPDEYPERYSSIAFNMARNANEALPAATEVPTDALQHILSTLQAAQQTATALQGSSTSPQGAAIVDTALRRVARLRMAWNSLGVWDIRPDQLTDQDRFEMRCASAELDQRLYELQRECMLLAENLGEAERTTLSPIWATISTL